MGHLSTHTTHYPFTPGRAAGGLGWWVYPLGWEEVWDSPGSPGVEWGFKFNVPLTTWSLGSPASRRLNTDYSE